jgi:DNA-binding NarL/FixJ family response regulator
MSSESRIPITRELPPSDDSGLGVRESGIFERPLDERPEDSRPTDAILLSCTSNGASEWPSPALRRAAVEADHRSTRDFPLARVWDDCVHGRLRAWWEGIGAGRVFLAGRLIPAAAGACPMDAPILARVLCGEPQKVIAAELGIAPSTISGRYVRALAALDILHRRIPLALVLAAQSASGIRPIPTSRISAFEHRGRSWTVFSFPRPSLARMGQLTAAEQAIARCIIEGRPRFEIARLRATSVNTVARQFHSIFCRLKATGRFSLIRRAVELEGFQPALRGD